MASESADSNEERDRLRRQYTEIASLAGGLAHEIKNPLSTLNLNLQLLAEDFAKAENQNERRALQKIHRLRKECLRLEEILDDFLRFCRLGDLNLQPCDLNDVVREMIDFHAPQIDLRDARRVADVLQGVRVEHDE